jgi:hypothetical protein
MRIAQVVLERTETKQGALLICPWPCSKILDLPDKTCRKIHFLTRALVVLQMIFSFFNDKHLLAPKHSGVKCSTPLHSWSDSPIGCSAPLYSRSSSLIGSAYSFLCINLCFRFNKSLTNLTLLHQHHLQYSSKEKSFITFVFKKVICLNEWTIMLVQNSQKILLSVACIINILWW